MSRRACAHRRHAPRAASSSMQAIVRIACIVVCCPCGSFRHSRRLGQYAHTAWRVQDGAPGASGSGTRGGRRALDRLGARPLPVRRRPIRAIRSPAGPDSPVVPAPRPARSAGHLAVDRPLHHRRERLSRGRIVTYGTKDGLPGGGVTAIARDSSGTMWAATSRGLARLVDGSWEAIDTAAGFPGGYTEPVFVDRSGSVWAAAEEGSTFYREGRRTSRSAS